MERRLSGASTSGVNGRKGALSRTGKRSDCLHAFTNAVLTINLKARNYHLFHHRTERNCKAFYHYATIEAEFAVTEFEMFPGLMPMRFPHSIRFGGR